MLFAKNPEGVSEVINDVNSELTNFWDVVQTENLYIDFKRQVDNIPFSENEWCWSLSPTGSPNSYRGKLERALKFFVRYRQSRQGLGENFATLSRTRVRRGMNEQVSSWLSAIDSLPEAHARLRRVVILNRDAIDVILQQDGKDTLFYLDPCYLPETRTAKDMYGEFEMTAEQHAQLLEVLSTIKGKFLLSGYPSKMYHRAAKQHGWSKTTWRIDNKASAADKKEIKSETVWQNF